MLLAFVGGLKLACPGGYPAVSCRLLSACVALAAWRRAYTMGFHSLNLGSARYACPAASPGGKLSERSDLLSRRVPACRPLSASPRSKFLPVRAIVEGWKRPALSLVLLAVSRLD